MLETSSGTGGGPSLGKPSRYVEVEKPTTRHAVYQYVDRRLVAAGWHDGPFWHGVAASALTRNVSSERCVSGGRRSGKSSFICRVGVAELLAGAWGIAHPVSPGDIGTVSIVSARQTQARDRLHTIKQALGVLGVNFRPHYDWIDLVDAPYRIAAYAANAGSVVSQSSICVILDEVARWKEDAADAASGEDIIAAIGPSLAQDPDGLMWAMSSPGVENDLHDTMYTALVPVGLGYHCPTWVGNPTITEQRCRDLCTRGGYFDEAKFNREYAAIPASRAASTFFDPASIDAAILHL